MCWEVHETSGLFMVGAETDADGIIRIYYEVDQLYVNRETNEQQIITETLVEEYRDEREIL